jgi:hypothetical protein
LIKERLLAHSVTTQQDSVAEPIPESESPHTLDTLEKGFSMYD